MDMQIQKCIASLHSRHIQGVSAENSKEASEKILGLIPREAVVGIGDSSTIRQLDLLQKLKERKTKVLNPFEQKERPMNPEDAREYTDRVSKEATLCDVFLTGTNAITRDGRLISVDAVGNRVAGMFWGHPISIIAVGKNKIVKDLDEAFDRIRNTIAPHHVRLRVAQSTGRKTKTPCARTGECQDCRSRERACNIFTIIEGKPLRTKIHVVIVNEDLGLGWDPSWPKDRIMQIIERHKRFFWVPQFEIHRDA
jgi:hypothetical protein